MGFVIFLCIFVVVLSRFFYLSDMIKLDFFSVQISYLLILFSDVFFFGKIDGLSALIKICLGFSLICHNSLVFDLVVMFFFPLRYFVW